MGGMMIVVDERRDDAHPERAPMMTPIASARALRLGQERLELAHRRSPQCSTTLAGPWTGRSSRRSRSRSGRGGRCRAGPRRPPGTVVARFAALRWASSAGESTPAASSRSEYSEPTPLMRIRSTWLTHSRMSSPARCPVESSSACAAGRLGAPLEQRRRSVVMPALGELRGVDRADPLDLVDVRHASSCVLSVACDWRAGRAGADDTLADPPATTVRAPRRTDGPGVPRRDDGRLRADRAGPRHRQRDARRRARSTTRASRSPCRCSTATG